MGLFPLRYARQNVLFGQGGETAALYRLDLVSYPFLPVAEKWALLRRLERLATVVGADFSLWRVNRAYPADRYVADTIGLLDERGQDSEAWRSYLVGHRRRLDLLAAHVPEVYLAVSLTTSDKPDVKLGRGLVRQVDRARRRIEDLTGVAAARPISAGELERLAVAEQRVYDRLTAVIGCDRGEHARDRVASPPVGTARCRRAAAGAILGARRARRSRRGRGGPLRAAEPRPPPASQRADHRGQDRPGSTHDRGRRRSQPSSVSVSRLVGGRADFSPVRSPTCCTRL